MSSFTAKELSAVPPESASLKAPSRPLPPAAGYGLSLASVAAATVAAFIVDTAVGASNLSLVFVLPVVIAAASFGWGPALAAALTGMLAFDFFFVEPRFTFSVAHPADLWALALFLIIAAIVSSVAAESRRRALEARESADQANALQALANVVIKSPSAAQLARAGADALARVFKAPAVVFVQRGEALALPILAGDAKLSSADEEAARLAFTSRLPTKADTYPVDGAGFDFWPVETLHGRLVLGVKFSDLEDGRPDQPERLIEMVGAYLAQATAGPPSTGAS